MHPSNSLYLHSHSWLCVAINSPLASATLHVKQHLSDSQAEVERLQIAADQASSELKASHAASLASVEARLRAERSTLEKVTEERRSLAKALRDATAAHHEQTQRAQAAEARNQVRERERGSHQPMYIMRLTPHCALSQALAKQQEELVALLEQAQGVLAEKESLLEEAQSSVVSIRTQLEAREAEAQSLTTQRDEYVSVIKALHAERQQRADLVHEAVHAVAQSKGQVQHLTQRAREQDAVIQKLTAATAAASAVHTAESLAMGRTSSSASMASSVSTYANGGATAGAAAAAPRAGGLSQHHLNGYSAARLPASPGLASSEISAVSAVTPGSGLEFAARSSQSAYRAMRTSSSRSMRRSASSASVQQQQQQQQATATSTGASTSHAATSDPFSMAVGLDGLGLHQHGGDGVAHDISTPHLQHLLHLMRQIPAPASV